MPVYEVISRDDLLTDEQRRQVATEITRVHTTATGAPALFVNVVFRDLRPDRTFSAGKPSRLSLIVGTIREGRTLEVKQQILRELSEMWTTVTGVPTTEIIVAVRDIDPRVSMEMGLLFPLPGDEAAWFRDNSARLAELGITSL